MKKPKTLQELNDLLNPILPRCTFGEDAEGQLVIYTDLSLGKKDKLIDFDDCPIPYKLTKKGRQK